MHFVSINCKMLIRNTIRFKLNKCNISTKQNALKDFKNGKIEIYNIYLLLMSQFYCDLAKMNINMSAKQVLNCMSK